MYVRYPNNDVYLEVEYKIWNSEEPVELRIDILEPSVYWWLSGAMRMEAVTYREHTLRVWATFKGW